MTVVTSLSGGEATETEDFLGGQIGDETPFTPAAGRGAEEALDAVTRRSDCSSPNKHHRHGAPPRGGTDDRVEAVAQEACRARRARRRVGGRAVGDRIGERDPDRA